MLHIARTVVFGLSISLAIFLLGLSALEVHWEDSGNVPPAFLGLSMATCILTLLSLPAMLVIDAMRSGLFTSTIAFELVTLFVLWVFWLGTAAYGTQFFTSTFGESNCNVICTVNWSGPQAWVVCAYLAWALLMVYSITVLVMAIKRAKRGEHTWTISVRHAHFFDPRSRLAKPDPAPFDIATMQQLQWPANLALKPLQPTTSISTPDLSTREPSPPAPSFNILYIARTVVFGLSTVFAILVMVLSTSWGVPYVYPTALVGLSIATSAFTLISLPAMLIIDVMRSGAFTSMIAIELVVLSVLCVFWIVTAAYGTQLFLDPDWQVLRVACPYPPGILLMGYAIVVLVMAVKRAQRGERTWTISVKNARFFDPRSRTAKSGHVPFDIGKMQQLQWPAGLVPKPLTPATSTQDLSTREPSLAGDAAA
ncbi:hypothetical protein FIBSPDRAFT_953220 [Athelia psychrophila]|uniref:MARVEL domain-containing protein n=1 Tax=Athelia psychrophila TaxID=1759441 RepID=A0A166KPX3_9AGAM|nr:hypothetical protein FIBSPDRAFT_953220 [Fibularhizoctonia sp. CBS 109695]